MIKESSQEKLKISENFLGKEILISKQNTFILFRLCYIIMYIQCIYI